jgi:pilus assembly protein CpaD
MSKRILTLLLAPTLMLGACSGTLNRGLESVHQPVVSRSDYAFDVATTPGGLAPGETKRLAGWMASLQVGYGDRVAIDDPTQGVRARDDVAAQAAQFGLLVSDDAPISAGQVTPGMLRVVITRMKATVPGCPDFSHMSQPEFNSNTSSNQGCAINANLAAMVANPADLVRGQPGADGGTPGTSLTSYKAIDTYRKAAPSGGGGATIKTDSAGGK